MLNLENKALSWLRFELCYGDAGAYHDSVPNRRARSDVTGLAASSVDFS
jgi:hypothetical protein